MYDTLLTVIGSIITTYLSTIGLQKWKNKNSKKKIGAEYNDSVKEDAAITSKLEEILHDYKASYVRIYVRHNGEILANGKSYKKVSMMYERHASGLTTRIAESQGLPSSIFYSVLEKLSEGNVFDCADVSQMTDVVLKDLFQKQFIKSKYFFLMSSMDGIDFGMVSVSFCKEKRELKKEEIEHLTYITLKLSGYFSGKPIQK